MKRFGIAVLLVLVACGGLFWIVNPFDFRASSSALKSLQPAIQSEHDRGIAIFAFGDFGALSSDTLQTSAAPWKLAVSALALQETGGDIDALTQIDVAAIYRKFGFHSPQTIANWPASLPEPDLTKPVGINTGYAEHGVLPIAVTIGNTGCAACHSSVIYRSDGTPDPERIWLGMPNGSINLEAYASALYAAFRDYGDDGDRLLDAVKILFPGTSWSERQTLRFAVLPLLQEEMDKRSRSIGRLLPFPAGLPGATNGLDALRNRLGLIPEGSIATESVFNSVPELGGRLWRRSFLNTASYVPPDSDPRLETLPKDLDGNHRKTMASIVAYFTVPSMGVTAEVAEAHIGDAEAVLTWMAGYQPQPFPGEIDRQALPFGREVYRVNCGSCHGRYNDSLETPELVSFPNWQGSVGTDNSRMDLTDDTIAEAVNTGLFGRYIDARSTNEYVAPPLTGIWASAPYLHNGSIPTLWHLMHPERRPKRFVVGGHALDMEKIGLRGEDDGAGGWLPAADYAPWALSVEVDVSRFGLGNQGHEREFTTLTDSEKNALLEYLKLL